MSDHRTIEQFHATRESGVGCPGADGGPHYFAFLGYSGDRRSCIDCGEPEPLSPDAALSKEGER